MIDADCYLKFRKMLKEVGLLLGSLMVGSAPPKSTLKAVLLLIRHGDRAPNSKYPNDPHSAYEWPGGIGALSPRGEQQMTQCGVIKSVRYASLMTYKNGVPQSDNMTVVSSSVRRCIETANRFLNGFLSSTKFPADLVKVIPSDQDECLILFGKPCPAYQKTLYQGCSLRHPNAHEFIKSRQYSEELFKLVEKESGMPMRSLLTIFFLEDIFMIQQINGLRLPDWVEPIYKDFIQPIAEYCFDSLSGSKYMQIRSGVLLKDMVDRLDQFVSGKTNKNIVLYSAHDVTISGLTHLMDVIGQCAIQPKYGSSFALELHENPQLRDDYEVKLFYFRDHADQDPVQIVLPGMEAPYSFEKFKKVMGPKMTFDYEAVCREVADGRAKM